jgi:hypothetical protein
MSMSVSTLPWVLALVTGISRPEASGSWQL